jgi:hypothetical protein
MARQYCITSFVFKESFVLGVEIVLDTKDGQHFLLSNSKYKGENIGVTVKRTGAEEIRCVFHPVEVLPIFSGKDLHLICVDDGSPYVISQITGVWISTGESDGENG